MLKVDGSRLSGLLEIEGILRMEPCETTFGVLISCQSFPRFWGRCDPAVPSSHGWLNFSSQDGIRAGSSCFLLRWCSEILRRVSKASWLPALGSTSNDGGSAPREREGGCAAEGSSWKPDGGEEGLV
mmetsp:Transcript_37995/g.89812  ORF Transcript_37995/g.89812 Transcript_37995/m.89812 type:complete len:127 (-) Transcript_37995:2-382(-)